MSHPGKSSINQPLCMFPNTETVPRGVIKFLITVRVARWFCRVCT